MMKTRLLSLLVLLMTAVTGAWADELTVHDGTAGSPYVPVYGFYEDAYLKCEYVMPASELEAMNGSNIDAMKFYLKTSAAEPWTGTYKVFMKEVSATTISEYSGLAGATVVYEGKLDGTGETMDVIFDTPYQYHGGNLLIGFYCIDPGNYKSAEFWGETVEGACVQGYSYSGLNSIDPNQRNFLPKTTFTYEVFGGYKVEVPAGEYVTYYSDKALFVEDDDAKLYTVTAVSDADGKATATELKVAAANTPLLVKNNSKDMKTFLLIPTDDAADDVKAYEGFKGTLVETVISASDEIWNNYALNGLEFVWVKDALSVGANKAWLEILTPSVDAARTLTIVFGDESTGISLTPSSKGEGSIYTLDGRKTVNAPTKKGVYIVNGRKVVIK